MYFFLGISLTLAFLLIVNMIGAAFASAFWAITAGRLKRLSVQTRAQLIFGLRVLPFAASLIFIFAFVVPSYLLHEPDSSGEIVSGKLGLIALLSSVGVLASLLRVIGTWLATRRLTESWLKKSEVIYIPGVAMPVHRIPHDFPVLAVVGIFQPKLFAAERVLNSLDKNELTAAMAHEYGHLAARDNLKRSLLRACRDLVVIPLGDRMDREWAQHSESAADEYAAARGRGTALNLASAIVKVSRLVPAGLTPSFPGRAFLVDGQAADIAGRVRRLISLSESGISDRSVTLFGLSPLTFLTIACLLLAITFPVFDERSLFSTHAAVEQFVDLLR